MTNLIKKYSKCSLGVGEGQSSLCSVFGTRLNSTEAIALEPKYKFSKLTMVF